MLSLLTPFVRTRIALLLGLLNRFPSIDAVANCGTDPSRGRRL